MMINYILSAIILFSLYSCKGNNRVESSTVKASEVNKAISILNFSKEEGLIILKNNFDISDTLTILNKDGSVWYQFSFKYDDSDGKYDFYNELFQPYAFHPDNLTLALRTTSNNGNIYEVIVNEKSKLKKYINIKNERSLKFIDWEQYILNAFSIEFNNDKNPLLDTILGERLNIDYSTNYQITPKEIKDDWLKIEIELFENKETYSGWIKWRNSNKNQILINILTN